jgi:vancomycin resistance protein YoaR
MWKPSKYVWGWAAALLLAALLPVAAVYGYAVQAKLPHGFTAGGWRVDGLTYNQFREQWRGKMDALKRFRVSLSAKIDGLPAADVTLGQLGVQTNEAALMSRLELLRTGSIWSRAKQRWQMRNSSFTLDIAFQDETLERVLRPKWPRLYDEQPVDAKRVITPDDRVTYVAEKNAYRIDAAALKKRLAEALPKLSKLGTGGGGPVSVDVPLVLLAPKVTVAGLKAEGIERNIVEFTTDYPTSGSGRVHNIEATASVVNDILLKPGDVFDYAKIIEQTEAKFGYQEAPVILNGKLVPGIGGGICQVSTTLYNAVLRGGLEIVERRNHSLPISYVPMGQDATFSQGYINFKFRNNTGYSLLIRTAAGNGHLTVKLFGKTPAGTTYDVESRIVKTLDPPVKYVRNPSLRSGQSLVILQGKPGYIVETVRLKKQNGAVVSKETVSRDTYVAQPTVVATNSGASGSEGSDKDTPDPLLEDGIKGPVFR